MASRPLFDTPGEEEEFWREFDADYQERQRVKAERRALPRSQRARVIAEVPRGQQVHHVCENPWCENPEHLIAVSADDHRKLHKRRGMCMRGDDVFDPFAEEVDQVDAPPIPPPTPPPPVPQDADPDEEPPEPEGHALSKEVADWLAANGGQEFFHGPLPHDIAAIWSHPPHRAMDEATARILISAWGIEEFRRSALHTTALAEKARMVNSEEVTARFKAEREKKKAR